VTNLVSCCGEEGLLSIAFHPRYAENGRVFVYYTNRNGDLAIARYTRSAADPNRVDPATATVILTIPHPVNSNHNGGQLHFGPDGYLYAGTGDGGGAGDPSNNAQNLRSLLGKLLRLDVDQGATYSIPASNPFALRDDARGEVWAYGLRNPWRFSFDRATGDLWIGDVGQRFWEEVNVQSRASSGGENYGWRRMEGTHCYNPSIDCRQPEMILPVIEYAHGTGDCSVTGGFRYRGLRSPALRGRYVYGDYCSGRIWAASLAGESWTTTLLRDTNMFISAFGEDVRGELYVADLGGGAVYRIVDDTPQAPRRRAVLPR
jgi:glucose/arabinose dehydrogenase